MVQTGATYEPIESEIDRMAWTNASLLTVVVEFLEWSVILKVTLDNIQRWPQRITIQLHDHRSHNLNLAKRELGRAVEFASKLCNFLGRERILKIEFQGSLMPVEG